MSLFDWADTESSATFSDDYLYRYTLTRRWARSAGFATFVMLNPSTADAEMDDPTIRRCIGFARSWGLGGLVVVNLYALRSTDPKGLWKVADPVGPDNDAHLERTAGEAEVIVASWGANARPDRVDHVLTLPGMDRLQCLGTTLAGAPKHPLARGVHRIPDTATPVPWPEVA